MLIGNILKINTATNTSTYSGEVSTGGIIGRVTAINLTDPNNLGQITFEALYGTVGSVNTALPININVTQFPIVGEIVKIIPGPSKDINNTSPATDLYYYPPYSLWSTNVTNEFPDLRFPISESVSLKNGVVYGLRPFEGDVTVQSRYGSSIRFGSTSEDKKLNPWSSTGQKGDPVLIITNGHQQVGAQNWDLIQEDINTDQSSIWLTSTQAIDVLDIKENFSIESFLTQQGLEQAQITELKNDILPVSYQTISPANRDKKSKPK